MPAATTDPSRLADELAAAMPAWSNAEQRLAITLYRLLAEGAPVPPERLAERTGQSIEDVQAALERWPGVFLDEDGAVVGFWGVALGEMPHRMDIDGRRLYAWCAWDTLFLPELFGRAVTIESTCPTTEEPIRLRVTPDGVEQVAPSTAVLSFLRPDQPFDADVIMSFCHFVHFFANEPAAREWTAQHDKTFIVSIDEGFEIGRLTNRANFGDALAREEFE